MPIKPRLRGVIIAGASLAVIAGAGIGFAVASPAEQTRYVTASAGTGDVAQTYTATGTITRTNTSDATFAVDGTVSSVKVAVGDTVDASQVLAVLKKGPLQLAVLDAETSVAEAKASLYAAQHPSSSGGTSTSSGSASSGSSSGASSGSGSSSHTVTIDPTALVQATKAVTEAVTNERTACAPVFGAVPDPEPTTTPTPTESASPTTSPSASATPTATASPTASATSTATATASETATAEPTASATIKDQADTIESNDPTEAELKACGEARAQVNIATANLQTLVMQLTAPSNSKPSGSTGSGSKSSSTSSSSSTATVSATQVASAKAKLLEAEQELQAAQDDLDNAELLAPISGTVGTVSLAAGNTASAGSITIVGEGNAQVSFELPLKTRTTIKAGLQVTVTPAGSTRTLSGKVTSISAVETSGTAGDTPTYTTVVTVTDPDGLLASGAKASVTIPVHTATNVARVPASAVTPTGTGTATVSVLESGSETAKTVEVKTGATGGGWVEITSGLTAGQTVVLADNTAELPSNTSNRRTTTTATARASASASAAAQPAGGSTTQPSAAPSATPTR